MEQPNIDYKAIAADISNRCNQLLQCVDVNTVSGSNEINSFCLGS